MILIVAHRIGFLLILQKIGSKIELDQPSDQGGGNETFSFLRCEKLKQEIFGYLTKVEVSYLDGWP